MRRVGANRKLSAFFLSLWARNRNASLLYVDNPVGTGFSYTSNASGYPNFVNQSSDDLFVALQQFFTIFHEYKDRLARNTNTR